MSVVPICAGIMKDMYRQECQVKFRVPEESKILPCCIKSKAY